MVQNKLHWMILLGLLAAGPLAAFGQTWNPLPTTPFRSVTGVSMRLIDSTPLAVATGIQEREQSTAGGDSDDSDSEKSEGAEQENKNAEEDSTDDDESDSSDSDLGSKAESDEQEKSLADSFPVTNLRGGINDNSLQRAIAKREITDPNMEFLASAGLAPTEYQCHVPQIWKTWDSPNVRYRPLYFEDQNLERYGNHVGHHLQPYKSGLHFASRVITLPYQIAAQGIQDCEYGMGYFRPGNCNPAYQQQFELSKRGVLAQALAVGLILGL